MDDYVRKRAVVIARHIISTDDTIRQTAELFSFSKSTIHKDIHDRLPLINKNLSYEVGKVMDKHLEERSRKGGIGKRGYRKNKNN